jgi:hypothetical protein
MSDRFVELIKRELGAADVEVVDAPAEGEIAAILPDGRYVVARFGDAPAGARDRLRNLVESFGGIVPLERRSRPSLARLLHDELLALAEKAGAADALVIDADSPIIWGDAARLDDDPGESAGGELSMRAIDRMRSLRILEGLHKGRPIRYVLREDDMGLLAHSFAAIYVLLLVYPAPFDELRAERAAQEWLPRIERIVTSLPPLDPTPEPRGAVIRMPRRR